MTEDDGLWARCDYCGNVFPVRDVKLYWCYVETREDGRGIFTTGIYCSEPCGYWSANRVGASRG
jgi:hypothetical protein